MTGTLTAIIYALTAAAFWGAGDFSGGVASKRNNVYGVVIFSQGVGLLWLLGAALLFHEAIPNPETLLFGALAGVFGGSGLIALYAALAQGRMGVAAPVAAVVTTIIPVIVGIRVDGLPGSSQLAGFVLALVAVWLVSRTNGTEAIQLSDLKLPVLAGLGFGLFMVFISKTSDEAIFWPLIMVRIASVSLLLLVARFLQSEPITTIKQPVIIFLAGVFDSGGNIFFALASQAGRLDIAAVVSSLYPAGTVLLAWLLLKEKIGKQQWLGLLLALTAIVWIA